MKKLFAVAGLFAAMLMANPADAQIKVGAGLMLGMPSGDWADGYGMGIGGGINGSYMVTDNISVGLNVGYMSFGPKEELEGFDASFTMIPVIVSGNWHFMPGEDFDFYAGLGIGFISNKITVTTPEIDLGGGIVIPATESEASEGGFAIAVPRVGASYMFNDNWGADLNIAYTLNMIEGGADFIGINLGVVYALD